MTSRDAIIKEIKIRERQKELKEGLPYLYGWKHYKWSREFFESRNKENFLVAANQIGKSSVAIRKCIHWATAKDLWTELWQLDLHGRPNLFWYFYPTRDVATVEFKTKWSLFLPSGSFKSHPVFGWHAEYDRKQIVAVHFNSGVSVYFKTYAQNVTDLQAATVYALFVDEELPVDLLPELSARLNASDGYYHAVFTATSGQEHWRRCLEEVGGPLETHKGAFKKNVSLYDCLEFEDGSPGPWTEDKIKRAIAKCPTKAEVQRRIYGRFVVGDGLKYSAFEHERNTTTERGVPKGWHIYGGVDVGSGGEKGHPAAIAFVAVSPDFTQGRVFSAWRGDGVDTTNTDILIKYRDMRGDMKPMEQVYDYASKDFFTIASRLGETFTPAEKNHEIGEGIFNTLLRHGMLKIVIGDSETDKLIAEICSLLKTTPKRQAQDDLCDVVRYICAAIPWDYKAVEKNIDLELAFKKAMTVKKPKKLTHEELIDKEREEQRQAFLRNGEPEENSDELAEWAELYGA